MRLNAARIVLTTLAILAGEVGDWVDLLTNPRVDFYSSLSGQKRFRRTAEQIFKIGDIEKRIKDGKVFYRLTSSGWEKLTFEIPFWRFQGKPWDGKWRLVIYDIPEKERKTRDALRVKLKSLLFGQWQRSVWITPHPVLKEIESFLEANHLFPFVRVFEARQLAGEDEKSLAKDIWRLEGLNEKYFQFLEKRRKKDKDINRSFQEFIEILEQDPGLPKELLPEKWYGFSAQEWFRRTKKVHEDLRS